MNPIRLTAIHTMAVLKSALLLLLLSVQGAGAMEGFSFKGDTIIPRRVTCGLAAVGGGYAGTTYGLYKSWYAPYRTEDFHLYNDWGEWNNIDKAGHLYGAYFQTALLYRGARWAGIGRGKARGVAVGLSVLFMSTIEIMDGFSSGWGFSLPDMAANLLGTGLFLGQEFAFGRQWVHLKWSASLRSEPPYSITGNGGTHYTLAQRSQDLFGSHWSERLLKDYNATHVWASFSLPEGLTHGLWPKWLNIALGVGGGNLYGGYENKWSVDREKFEMPPQPFPRYTSVYLSPDINWTVLPAKNYWVKNLFVLLNVIKLPAPTVEYQSTGQWKWHWLLF